MEWRQPFRYYCLHMLTKVPPPPAVRLLGIDLLCPSVFHKGMMVPPAVLAAAVRRAIATGFIEPVVCRPSTKEPGKFEIIENYLAWRIAQEAQIHDIPVVVYELDDTAARLRIYADFARWRREKLDPISTAEQLWEEINSDSNRWGAQRRVGDAWSMKRAHVTQHLALLDLCPAVKQMGRDKKLSFSQLRVLVGLEADDQIRLANEVVTQKLTVTALQALIAELRGTGTAKATRPAPGMDSSPPPSSDPNVRYLEGLMGERLGCRVSLGQTSFLVDVGGDLSVLAGVIEKLAESAQKSGCRVTYDSKFLSVEFANGDGLEVILKGLGLTNL